MAKRLSKQEKVNIFTEELINRMFEIAGHKVTYQDIKDRKDDWFHQWSMTTEQHDMWMEWMIEELRKRFRMNKSLAKREATGISFFWGLKISDLSE